MESLEKLLQLKKYSKKIFLCVIIFTLCLYSNSEEHIQQNDYFRFKLWALIDEIPLKEYKQDNKKQFYDFSVQRLKELAPFVLEGMIYGWNFTYTPSDKARNIEEFFEFYPAVSFTAKQKDIKYEEPWIENGMLNVWIEFKKNQSMVDFQKQWNSIQNPKISGIGYGKMIDGVEGIQHAYSEAIKNAVRSHAQGLTRNKPKEITGSVLLYNYPKLRIDAGKYCANLDFYLQIHEIIPYTVF